MKMDDQERIDDIDRTLRSARFQLDPSFDQLLKAQLRRRMEVLNDRKGLIRHVGRHRWALLTLLVVGIIGMALLWPLRQAMDSPSPLMTQTPGDLIETPPVVREHRLLAQIPQPPAEGLPYWSLQLAWEDEWGKVHWATVPAPYLDPTTFLNKSETP
jgi:hypothetical protein